MTLIFIPYLLPLMKIEKATACQEQWMKMDLKPAMHSADLNSHWQGFVSRAQAQLLKIEQELADYLHSQLQQGVPLGALEGVLGFC